MPVEVEWREVFGTVSRETIDGKQLPSILGYLYDFPQSHLKHEAIRRALEREVLQELEDGDIQLIDEDGVTEIRLEDDEQPEKPDDCGENQSSRAGGNSTDVQLPSLPNDKYGSTNQELYRASARLLARYSPGDPTLQTRIRGIRTTPEAAILASAEANHQARRPVVAAINARIRQLERTDDPAETAGEDPEETVIA